MVPDEEDDMVLLHGSTGEGSRLELISVQDPDGGAIDSFLLRHIGLSQQKKKQLLDLRMEPQSEFLAETVELIVTHASFLLVS